MTSATVVMIVVTGAYLLFIVLILDNRRCLATTGAEFRLAAVCSARWGERMRPANTDSRLFSANHFFERAAVESPRASRLLRGACQLRQYLLSVEITRSRSC